MVASMIGWKTTWVNRRIQRDGTIYQENRNHAQIAVGAPVASVYHATVASQAGVWYTLPSGESPVPSAAGSAAPRLWGTALDFNGYSPARQARYSHDEFECQRGF